MKIVNSTSPIVNTANLKRWNDYYPDLVDPNKILLHDNMTAKAGQLALNSPLKEGPSGSVWTAVASDQTFTADGFSGVGATNGRGMLVTRTGSDSAGEAGAWVRFTADAATPRAGLAINGTGFASGNSLLVYLSPLNSGELVVRRFINGALQTVIASVAAPVAHGQWYAIRAQWSGSTLRAWAAGKEVEASYSAVGGALGVGVYARSQAWAGMFWAA